MVYTPKVILHAPSPDSPHLCEFVEACLRDKVGLICVVGDHCEVVEDIIDELVVADGSDEGRFLVTTSHKSEPLQDVIEFAKNWSEMKGDVSEVTLS